MNGDAARGPGLGLFGATLVGVSAMMGAGIFVLCGVAFREAGPAAMVAFALNAAISLVTAFSFAELASAFPESGGSYVFARKVFPIGGAFAAGWVLWLAYVMAAALYGLGFASFLRPALEALGASVGHPLSLAPWFNLATAVAVIACGGLLLVRRGASAGTSITLAKVVAFGVLIVAGLVVLAGRPAGTVAAGVWPLLPEGQSTVGILLAMGFTYIALEGFEVIAAVAEEVRDPSRTVPRAMFLSIGITITIYLLLLLVMLTVGGPLDGTPAWKDLGAQGDQAVAVAARRYMGFSGWLVVIVAGLLSTFTALASALLAASRVSFSMARDRALPRALSRLGGPTNTPVAALGVSTGLAVGLILLTGNVEVAGITASLIFLLSFALANGAGLLVRVRAGALGSYRAPFYPAMPLLGIAACIGLAGFQIVAEPRSTVVALVWLAAGWLLYRSRFRQSAETVSARAEGLDASLARLRGREPLVLVPLAHPERAETLVLLAYAFAPKGLARVLAVAIARVADDASEADGLEAYDRAQQAVRRAVAASCRSGRPFDGIVRLAPDVAPALARMAAERHPEVIVLGMSRLDEPKGADLLERLVSSVSADVIVVQAASDWTPNAVDEILVAVAGDASHQTLRARLLGALERERPRRVTFLRVVREESERAGVERTLRELLPDVSNPGCQLEVVVSEDPIQTIIARSHRADLLLIGLGRPRANRPLVGDFVRRLAMGVRCPLIAIARASR